MTPRTGRPIGRPPKPTERTRAAGNPGKRAMPAAPGPGEGLAGVAAGAVPRAPEKLGATGRAWWRKIWAGGRTWLSPDVDGLIIEQLCLALDEAAVLRRGIGAGEIPRWTEAATGRFFTHPSVKRLEWLDAQIMAKASDLGFTPAARARLGLAEVRVRDELDELSRFRDERLRDERRGSATGS